MADKLKIVARVLPDGKPFVVTGREAQTLAALVARGSRGVSGWDFPGGPPFRLSAYIHDLRRFGAPIAMVWERHSGGRHGRFYLAGEVEILETLAGEAMQ